MMDACEFFLQEYDTVRFIVDDLFLKGLSDDQIRHQPEAGLNSIAWYLWHTTRWQDFANTLIANDRQQLLNDYWLTKMNVSRRDVGTGMTREECTAFNEAVNVGGLRAYWDAVGNSVHEVARSLPCEDLCKPVDTKRLQRMLDDGTIANERARWLPSFLGGKSKAWFLSMAVWHTAEHLLGGVVCVRRVSGIPVGL
jgi:DinB superfamily